MSDDSDDKHRSILSMGKTGIGKSTWLNLISGSKYFITSSTSKSCTKKVDTYKFRYEDFIIEPIDVPGLNDSEGNDQSNMNNVTHFLKKYDHGLNAVAILISASDHRLDGILQNSIKYLYNFFGKNGNFWDHVCIIVTHSPAYDDDIEELKKSMTTGEDSLHFQMQQMIKDVCNLDKEPDIPFFLFDSKHANYSPTKESLPIFMKWLTDCSSFKTENLEIKDVKWQYQEVRHDPKITTGQKKPIFKLIPGEPKMITVDEDVPEVVTEKRIHDVVREVEEWETRSWDGFDIGTLGFVRLFRKNKVKKIVPKICKEEVEEKVIRYKKVPKTIFSGQYGENQKELKGYYQEKTTIVETYTACWPYECNPEEIAQRKNPIKIDSTLSNPEISISYFDEKGNLLNPNNHSQKIEELESLKG